MKKIYLIAVVIALAAGLATYFFANELKTSKIVTGVDEATVLVAVEDIDKNTILTAEMFQIVKLPITAVSNATVNNILDIIGCMTVDKIYAGEQLLSRKIVRINKDNLQSGRLSYELENGMYAYSIYVKEENAVAHFLRQDDRINVYNDASPSVEPVLENVRVIRISDYTSNTPQDENVTVPLTSYSIITLELTKEQIPKLMELDTPDKDEDTKMYRIVLVSHIEANDLADDIEKADIPENQNPEPQTNAVIIEQTTAAPENEG